MKNEVPYHSKNQKELIKEFDSDINGLSEEKAQSRKEKYGPNAIPEKKGPHPILVFLNQFRSLMVYILIIAAAISYFLDRMIDVYVILVVILVNAAIGFAQEYKAEKAVKALKKMIVPQARIIRNGELIQIPAKLLVPGDIIILEEGDRIPADARILEAKDFRTVESSLTGESMPSDKFTKVMPEKTPLADRKNMVWLGTFVASGKAKAIVVSTGAHTAIGKLAKSLESIQPQKTHFQEKSDVLARQLAIISVIGAIIIFLVGYYMRGMDFGQIFLFTIASLVSAIPEGLPAVLAIVLAIGAYRMAKRKAVVRERYSTETLGIIDTIISDKTGTITENTMAAQEIFLPGQPRVEVSGTGWEPRGVFMQKTKQIVPLENTHINKLLHIAASCNNSRLYKEKDTEGKEVYKIIGDPTEAALNVLAEKAGLSKEALSQQETRLDDIPFNPALKYHASLSVLNKRGKEKQIYVVGAPEALLKHSSHMLRKGRKSKIISKDLKILEKEIDQMTGKAMRVLGLAYKEAPKKMNEIHDEDADNLIFVGLVGMSDPPRTGVKDAVKKAKKAGIRVIMATGDHKNTAIAVAKEVGLITKHKSGQKLALTGEELLALSDSEFDKIVREVSVFARLTPEVKLKIAKSLQAQGHIIAMTGDGVNDAPALKQADIGISMGRIGTDVARESSSLILTDDNFASIINAVEEGRTVFLNTRQTSFFLIATGLAQYSTIVTTLLIGMPLPLLPIQVLWLNLVTGGVTDVALATEQSHHETLSEKPRNKNENILNKEIFPFLALLTLTMLALTLFMFNYHLPDLEKARTAAFVSISFTQFFLLFNLRSLRLSLFKIGPFTNKFINIAFVISLLAVLVVVYNPFLQGIFEFKPLALTELGIIFLLASSNLWLSEIYKYLKSNNQLASTLS